MRDDEDGGSKVDSCRLESSSPCRDGFPCDGAEEAEPASRRGSNAEDEESAVCHHDCSDTELKPDATTHDGGQRVSVQREFTQPLTRLVVSSMPAELS